MNDDERKVIIYKVSEYRQAGSDESQRAPLSPVNRWLSYAIMIPVVVVLVLIGTFFFAAFFALAAVLVAVLAVRFWWLRRKIEHDMRQSADMTQKSETDQSIIIEDAQIIEETETRETEHKSR
jgi:hypothetical protein